MRDWTRGRRIAFGYVLLLVLLIVISGVAIYSLVHMRATFRSAVVTQRDRAALGFDAERLADASVVSTLRYLLTGDATLFAQREQRISGARQAATRLRDESATAGQQKGWGQAVELLAAWDTASATAMDAKRAGRDDDARRLLDTQVIPARDRERLLIEPLVAQEQSGANAQASDAANYATGAIWVVVAVSALALLAGIAFAWSLSRGLIRHLRTAIATLSAVSSDILAATAQQASGAAEEETAIHQTSATADEVRQTVALTTEKARGVARDAQETTVISRQGERAVEDSVKGTQEARARMEALAERVLALSEQATQIGDIVSTVNGLAEQSNLLAVNAGIEAAKAGEAGRGFAVVAGEVKALAEQSKQATSEIRRILGEIQRATQASVMAAEQGVKASEAGELTTGEAGEAIRALGDRLSESADAAQQILASAQQQTTGMEQVALAMQNIRQASAQNMASTRQVERAARDLDEVTQRLSALVAANGNGRGPRATA